MHVYIPIRCIYVYVHVYIVHPYESYQTWAEYRRAGRVVRT